MNHYQDTTFLGELSLRTLITPPSDIVSSTSGKVVLDKDSPFYRTITGTGTSFSVELPSPATLIDGWRVQIANTTVYPVALLRSSDTQLCMIPAGTTIEAILSDGATELWTTIGVNPTSYEASASVATTLNGTLSLSSTSPKIRFFTGTATGYSVRLPNATTLVEGFCYTLVNTSSQVITIRDAGGNALALLPSFSNTEALLQNLGTANGTWVFPVSRFSQSTQYQYYEDLTAASTTSSTFSNAAAFTTALPLVLGGLYRIGVFFSWTTIELNSDGIFRLTFNGTQVGPLNRVEAKEAANQSFWESGFVRVTGTGTVATIALQFAAETAGRTFTVNEARFEIWRID